MVTQPIVSAVCFDMDGLIFNTEDLYDEVLEILLNRRGQSFSLELKLKIMGLPGPEAFEKLRQDCGLDDSAETLQQETDEIFETLLPEKIQTMPGLETLMERIEAAGLPKAIATSSHRKFAVRSLGIFDLEPRFEFILTAADVERGKPHPDIYLEAARRLEHPVNEMLVLEDSLHGSTAAASAGALTIAVPGLHSQGQDFSHVFHVARQLDDPFILSLIPSPNG